MSLQEREGAWMGLGLRWKDHRDRKQKVEDGWERIGVLFWVFGISLAYGIIQVVLSSVLLGIQGKEEPMGTMRKKAGRGGDSGDSC